jgi:hypothetical protein
LEKGRVYEREAVVKILTVKINEISIVTSTCSIFAAVNEGGPGGQLQEGLFLESINICWES